MNPQWSTRSGGGGGGSPYDGLHGRLHPNGEPFSGFSYVKGPKGLTDKFYGFIKSRKRSIFVIDSYLNNSAFSSKQGM